MVSQKALLSCSPPNVAANLSNQRPHLCKSQSLWLERSALSSASLDLEVRPPGVAIPLLGRLLESLTSGEAWTTPELAMDRCSACRS